MGMIALGDIMHMHSLMEICPFYCRRNLKTIKINISLLGLHEFDDLILALLKTSVIFISCINSHKSED